MAELVEFEVVYIGGKSILVWELVLVQSGEIAMGARLKLMNIDSRICNYVIADFVKIDTPILTEHDSFVIQIGE